MGDNEMPDRSSLAGLVADTDPAIRMLLPDYVANRRADLELMQRALEDKDAATLRRLGHNLKGSGAAYGLPPVSALGRRIETAALAFAFAELRELRDRLEVLVRDLDAVVVESDN